MIRHIVLYWFKTPTRENLETAAGKLRSLLGKIPGLLSVEVEMDQLHSERSCDLCLYMVFDSMASLAAYRVHPAHLPVQKHMHASVVQSFSADYPVIRPQLRMPDLYAALGPASGAPETLGAFFSDGLAGVLLPDRKPQEQAEWLERVQEAALQYAAKPEILLPMRDLSQISLLEEGITGVICHVQGDEDGYRTLRRHLPRETRLLARLGGADYTAGLEAALAYADGLVFHRHDILTLYTPWEVGSLQQRIIRAARAAGKPLILAGDLLASMRETPVPTLAEMQDVSHAVADGVSGLILTNETAVGKHPIEAVSALYRIAIQATRL